MEAAASPRIESDDIFDFFFYIYSTSDDGASHGDDVTPLYLDKSIAPLAFRASLPSITRFSGIRVVLLTTDECASFSSFLPTALPTVPSSGRRQIETFLSGIPASRHKPSQQRLPKKSFIESQGMTVHALPCSWVIRGRNGCASEA